MNLRTAWQIISTTIGDQEPECVSDRGIAITRGSKRLHVRTLVSATFLILARHIAVQGEDK